MTHRPTVLLAHRSPSVLLGSTILLAQDGFRVAGEARSTASALALARLHPPDVVVLGDDLAGDVPGAVGMLREDGVDGVVVLTDRPDHPSTTDLVLAGANGLVPLDDLETLPVCLRAVLRGEPAIPRRLVGHLLEEYRRRHAALGAPEARLTLREAEIVELLRRGHATREIAAHLGVEPGTVRTHLAGARRKLQAVGRGDAVGLVGAAAR